MLINGGDDSNCSEYKIMKVNYSETRTSQNLNIIRAVKEHLNKNKILLSEELMNSNDQSESSNKDNISKQLIFCKYEYCEALVCESESIDGLYCSLACKNLDQYFINETTILSKKSTVDLKQLSTKCKNRIDKRKQLFPTIFPKNKIKKKEDGDEQLIHVFNKASIEENQSLLKLLPSIISSEAVDNDVNNSFELKSLVEDADVLKYMQELQIGSAPENLFDRPFPTEKNFFVVGQKLEGIDPKHQSLFCVMTVSEVCGYRIKLHFDGYRDVYDFWVNADCPDLFHPGWCELNSRILQLPNQYGNQFRWNVYLKECQASPAPKGNFVSTKNLNNCKNQYKFHVGCKFEASDKLNRIPPTQLIYVATVADVIGNRVRIHFDGRIDDLDDYWSDITSTNIHPVGWCDKNGRRLTPPSDYKDKSFGWTEYLENTNSKPVPVDAFICLPLREFSNKMIIEVVDLVVPRLLRIARVVNVKDDMLQIVYDGFVNDYAYWVEDNSPNIHPVGWSLKTNHPIELPPAPNVIWSCCIPGCKGYGNSSNSLKFNHISAEDCPYKIDSWKAAVAGFSKIPKRLKTHNVLTTTTLASLKTKNVVHHDDKNMEKNKVNSEHTNLVKNKEKINEKRLNFLFNDNNIEQECNTDIRNKLFNNTILSITNDKLHKTLGLSLVENGSASMVTLYSNWTRFNAQLGIPLFNTTDVRKWSVHEAASFAQKVVGCYYSNSYTKTEISLYQLFIDQEIDGESFLMLKQDDLIKILKMPQGPALKLWYAIITLRQVTSEYD